MENILLKYMSQRVESENYEHKSPGPVITISREYGCYASKIAQLLVHEINTIQKQNKKEEEWNVLSKEILEEAAKKLEVNPQSISHIFGAEEKAILGDIAISFSVKKYASDSNIKKTITEVVKSYAEQGNVIIVGRAGCVIAKHIPKSLHVRLIAPMDWKIEHVQEHYKFSKADAKKCIAENEEKRHTFMKFFHGNKPDSELFDIILNRAHMNENEIVHTILNLAKMRKLF